MKLLNTRTLDPKVDWNFFHDVQPLADLDRALIQPLTEGAAQCLWKELISPVPEERHPMLLPRDHWTGNVQKWGPDWKLSWPASLPDHVEEFLRLSVDIPEESNVYFIRMRECAVQVPWGVFLHTWRAFLFHDEMPLLISLQSPYFVVFPPLGRIAIGVRA